MTEKARLIQSVIIANKQRDEARALSHEGLAWAIRMGKGGLVSICDPEELSRFADYCYRAERLPKPTTETAS